MLNQPIRNFTIVKLILIVIGISYTSLIYGQDKPKDSVYFIASELPVFKYKNGKSADESFVLYVRDSLRLPAPTCQGKALVYFIVEKDGTISDVKIRRGLNNCPSYQEEIERLLVSMPKWTPGKLHDETVRVSVSMPAIFQADR